MKLLFSHENSPYFNRRIVPKKKTAFVLFHISQKYRFGKEIMKKEGVLKGTPVCLKSTKRKKIMGAFRAHWTLPV
jgi:hypothetical protein